MVTLGPPGVCTETDIHRLMMNTDTFVIYIPGADTRGVHGNGGTHWCLCCTVTDIHRLMMNTNTFVIYIPGADTRDVHGNGGTPWCQNYI